MTQKKCTILVVDDLSCVRSYVSEMLRPDFTVTEAENQEGAELAIRENNPGIVITDYTLPDGNGHNLLMFLKVMAPETPVILMTGYPRENFAKLGFDDILQKPFFRADLITMVERIDSKRSIN
jgi:DNA-binding NtrC family response regulator